MSLETQINFTRPWEVECYSSVFHFVDQCIHQDYKHGFGDLTREFWYGNDYIHSLTNTTNMTLRVELEAHDGRTAWAEYSTFR